MPFSKTINITANGERVTNLIFRRYDVDNGWKDMAKYDSGKGLTETVKFKAPKMLPNCGYQGCQPLSETIKILIYVVIGLLVLFVVLTLIALCYHRHHQQEKELLDMGWNINYTELKAPGEAADDLNFEYAESFISGMFLCFILLH